MALSHRNRQAMATEELEKTFSALSSVITDFLGDESAAIECSSLAKLVNEARVSLARERDMDEELTDKLESVFYDCGFPGGIIRAFGERRKHFIAAGEDKDGILITSPSVRQGIEDCSGLKISEPEYYRRDDMVLMVADAASKLLLESAYATAPGESGEVSGDTVRVFETADNVAYGLISDGMGSGEEARRTSLFVADFLSASLGSGAGEATLMDIMNSVIRRRAEECGASVDLFSLDLVNADACFIKSGAAVSFIKRRSSLFRIKSQTVPVGLIGRVDAEKISVTVEAGDYIIMLSDGIDDDGDSAWLVELLNKPNRRSLNDYASLILSEAKQRGGRDDMSVLVMRVRER
jgi:stage II sporulation protein E